MAFCGQLYLHVWQLYRNNRTLCNKQVAFGEQSKINKQMDFLLLEALRSLWRHNPTCLHKPEWYVRSGPLSQADSQCRWSLTQVSPTVQSHNAGHIMQVVCQYRLTLQSNLCKRPPVLPNHMLESAIATHNYGPCWEACLYRGLIYISPTWIRQTDLQSDRFVLIQEPNMKFKSKHASNAILIRRT